MGRWKNKVGFTLIELLVVVIIVAVLAAVGIPLLSGNIDRARLSEADAGLGTLRTSSRAVFAEKASFASIPTGNAITSAGPALSLKAGDLSGRFFGDGDYSIVTANATQFCATAVGSGVDGTPPTGAVRGSKVSSSVHHAIDQDGHIYDNTACSGSLLN